MSLDALGPFIRAVADYEKLQASIWLMNELEKGRRSGEEKGWLSEEEVLAHFEEKARENE